MWRLSRLAVGLSLIAMPLAVDAQPAGRVYRLGILSPTTPPAPGDETAAPTLIPAALRQLGYVEGRNLVVERRFAEGKLERLPGRARELVQLRVDVIVAFAPAAVHAAKEATGTIPIVIFANADPIAQGWAVSLARPGRNITGVVIAADTQLADKRLELIKEAVPQATRIAMLATAEPHVRDQVREAQKAAASLGVKLVVVEVRDGDYERAFASIVADRAHALVTSASPLLNRDRKRIIELAARHRLPAIYQWRDHVEDGGLMAYGSSFRWLAERAAAYVDRIFKGAKPAELPVEQPTHFELVINLKTAKALGLTIPGPLRQRADQLIE